MKLGRFVSLVTVIALMGLAGVGRAQVGKSLGLLDVNSVPVKQLASLPHMSTISPAMVALKIWPGWLPN